MSVDFFAKKASAATMVAFVLCGPLGLRHENWQESKLAAKEGRMHSNIRLVISFAIACVCGLATVLLGLPAAAGTNSWTAIGPVAYPFAVDPSSPSTIYAVVDDHTVTKTTDGGGHWADVAVFSGDLVNSLVIDPRSPVTIYAALGDPWDLAAVPIYKSIDGGAHWAAEAAEFNGEPTSVVAIAPSLSSTIYAGAEALVFKSMDGGLSWEMRGRLPGFYVSALAVDPTNADVVYVAQQVATFSGPDTGKIFKSTDGGALTNLQVWSLSIDGAGSLLRAATAAGLFEYQPTTQGAGIDLLQRGLTGAWYDPRTSGQGFMVVVIPDISPGKGIVNGSWLTYDNVVGGAERQRWYTLSGPVVSGQTLVSMTIYQNTGGNFDAPPRTTALPVGTATLSFDSCTSGQLVYSFTDGSGRTSTIPLTRLMQNATCSVTSERPTNADFALSGILYDGGWNGAPSTEGQGLSVEVNPVSGVLYFGWMTYAPKGAGAGPTGQRWYTGLGTFVAGSNSIPVQLYETTGGLFDDGTASPTTVVVGNGVLDFGNCANTLSFNFVGGSSIGASGTIFLDHIPAYSSGEGCWDY
jgi:photosystem II stability/assembly factor-like uncharacterized protein